MIRATIGGVEYPLDDYSVTEAATPLSGGDSSGEVGTIRLVIERPDEDLVSIVPGAVTAWTETARNLAPNPNTVSSGTGFYSDYGVLSFSGGYARSTARATGSNNLVINPLFTPVTAGQRATLRALVRNPTGVAFNTAAAIIWFNASTEFVGQVYVEPTTLAAGASGLRWASGIVPAGATQAIALLSVDNQAAGGSIDATAWGWYVGAAGSIPETDPPYFSGDTVSTDPNVRYRWIGAANASSSVLEVATREPDTVNSSPLNRFGSGYLLGEEVQLVDDDKGVTLGNVTGVSDSSGALIEVECVSRLGKLNVYNIQADPFVGTLGDAFDYYLSLANIETDLFSDEAIRNRAVVFPGWNGELWYYLKQMAASQDCDISLVSGVILLRPIRTRRAANGKAVDLSHSLDEGNLAQFVEIYRYDNKPITNQLVYPPGGWNPDVDVITVGAGETIEQSLDLSASLTSIVQPTMLTYVDEGYNSGSVYTVVADDGLPVSPALWAAKGGSLSVAINADTVSLTVFLTGATEIPTATGELSKNFSIALASDYSGNRYSTLRLVGSGVAYEKEKIRLPTGLTPQQTATEVGITIDNPFLTTMNQMYAIGTRAARRYSGHVPSLSGSVTAVNRLGESGSARYPSYASVQAQNNTPTVKTYAQVQASSAYAGKTYQGVQDYWFETVRSDFANQVFGNVAGLRVYDPDTRRFYRVRAAEIRADRIEFNEAEDDLTHDDIQKVYSGKTYAAIKALNSGLTYKQSNLAGMIQ